MLSLREFQELVGREGRAAAVGGGLKCVNGHPIEFVSPYNRAAYVRHLDSSGSFLWWRLAESTPPPQAHQLKQQQQPEAVPSDDEHAEPVGEEKQPGGRTPVRRVPSGRRTPKGLWARPFRLHPVSS